MPTNTQTLAAFVAEHGITLDIIDGPDYARDDQGWEHHAYTVRLAMDGQSIDAPWRAGVLITDDPTPEDLLNAFASDAPNVDSFEDWCDEFGYDSDSRKAEATYRACVAQTEKVAQWLGRESFERLLYGTERL